VSEEMQISKTVIKPTLRSAHTCKIGKVFTERRKLLFLSESQVASKISVNINYISAIEHGDYSIFPARIFALAYFKKYASFLNLKLDFFDIYNS
jgi:cytoskeletal protein RodZ